MHRHSYVSDTLPSHFIFQSQAPALSIRPFSLHREQPITHVYWRRPNLSPNIPTQFLNLTRGASSSTLDVPSAIEPIV